MSDNETEAALALHDKIQRAGQGDTLSPSRFVAAASEVLVDGKPLTPPSEWVARSRGAGA